MGIFTKSWVKKNKDLLQKLEHPKYEMWTINGHLIESSIAKRYMKFRHVIECHDTFKLDKQAKEVVFVEMEKAANNNQCAAVGQWVGLLRALDDMTYWENELFEVANCFIFLKGEPLNDFSLEHTMKKKQMFDDDPDVKLFFCQFGHEYLRHLENLPENTNVSEYLEVRQQRIVNSMYKRLILPELDKINGTPSTAK